MNPLTLSPDSLHSQIITLDGEITRITNQIKELPEGSATVYMTNGIRRVEGIYKGKRVHFTHDQLPLASQLILRKYLSKKLTELTHAKHLLQINCSFNDRYLGMAEQYLIKNPLRTQLLNDYFKIENESLRAWALAPACCAAPYQELRTEEALNGLMVRSKSEVLIVVYLYVNRIPFRYEDPLVINGEIFYPDFTIRDPKTGTVYWYEHFGQMDSEKYIEKTMRKLRSYAKGGLIPGVNFIMTFETRDHKLSLSQIQSAIEAVL